jgi:hypothetical protein
MDEHNDCGTPECCGQCDTATKMEVIEHEDGTKTVIFVPIEKDLPKQ